jgi:hypothetical protein
VVTALRARKDMIDRLGRAAAVLTPVAVATEYCTTRNRDRASVRDFDVSHEANHGGDVESGVRRGPDFLPARNHNCFLPQDEHNSPPGADYGKRLIACVQYEYS